MDDPRGAHPIVGAEAIDWGLVVHLQGTMRPIVVPWTFTERLAHASRHEREACRMVGTHHVRWDTLDEDLHVDDLHEWAKAQEDGALPFFAAEVPKTRREVTDLGAYRPAGSLNVAGPQSGSSEETLEGSTGTADIYLDPESWDVLRDILDELRSQDPAGVAAFELAHAQPELPQASQTEPLRGALLQEKADRRTLENAGRLTRPWRAPSGSSPASRSWRQSPARPATRTRRDY